MVIARRLISKRVSKALHFRKVLEIEGFGGFQKLSPRLKFVWFFGHLLGQNGLKRPLFKEKRKKRKE